MLPEGATSRSWRTSPAAMAAYLSRGAWKPAPHLDLVNQAVTAAVRAAGGRLIVVLPPRHGKSQIVSTWTPVWVLENWPERRILLASYEADFAAEWGAAARDLALEHRARLSFRLRRADGGWVPAANRWRTTAGGGMWTTGIGGALTGRGGDLLIIDDPFKNYDEAHSPTKRERVWNWYRSTARSRLHPDATVIVVMTRWHAHDLIGKLEAQAALDGEQWTVLRLPAIAEEAEPPFPDGMGRKPGEALWPEWYPAEALRATRGAVGEYLWAGLYQGHPAPATGGVFEVDKLLVTPGRLDEHGTRRLRRWDLAASSDGDYVAGVLLARAPSGRTRVEHVERFRAEPGEVERRLRAVTALDGPEVWARFEQEPGSSGKAYAQHLVGTVFAGHPNVRYATSTGDKETRARPFAAQVNAGTVELSEGPWNEVFVEELRLFPNGPFDDQCLAAGTLVLRPDGPCAIESVRVGDRVLGASGWVDVLNAGQTGVAPVYERAGLRGTAGHPVLTDRGWVPLLQSCQDDRLWSWDALRRAAIARRRRLGSACVATSASGGALAALGHSRGIRDALSTDARLVGSSYAAFAGSTTGAGVGTAILSPSWAPSAAPFESSRSSSTGSPSGGIPTHRAPLIAAITSPAGSGSSEAFRLSTRRSGSPSMGRFPPATTFTTAIATIRTTRPTISSAFPSVNTPRSMPRRRGPTGAAPSRSHISRPFVRSLPPGTVPRLGAHGTASTLAGWDSALPEPVFNLTTSDGTYFADGILVHNCDAASHGFNDLAGTPFTTGPALVLASRR